MTRKLCLGLLLSTTLLWAQPWQWEMYQGDYYNPTGFPNTAVRIGDFDGDGQGEILTWAGSQLLVFSKDSATFHWSADTCAVPPGSIGSDAVDLDGDGADEIIAIGNPFHAWKAISSDPWTWQSRDDLVAGFEQQQWTAGGVFGDFDQDGLLNGFFMMEGWEATFRLTERMSNGTWVTDTTFTSGNGISSGIYAGDVDHDGDRDFAIAPAFSDVPPFGGFGESTPQGIVWHMDSNWGWIMSFPGPTGGDLDGDGQWEGLYQYRYTAGYSLVEIGPGGEFVIPTDTYYLGSPGGAVFSNFRFNGQTVVGAVHNWVWGDPWPNIDAFECLMRSDSGWQPLDNRFQIGWDYNCASGNMADLNGDGRQDIFSVLVSDDPQPDLQWAIWENYGGSESDTLYYHWRIAPYFTHRFLSNPDTGFGYPQIGDITGDGRAELAVVAVPPDSLRHVLFYEMIGEIEDTTYVLHPEWSEGLPLGFNRIYLADIDGDGLAEVMARVPGDNWRTFFRRNGTWEEYENILPTVTDNNISFADADNDGDLDLFTPTQLYYSLSPSIANDSPFLPPSSFSLSAYPNPFNSEVTISYEVPQRGNVELAVYNLLGERVAVLRSGMEPAGSHAVQWQPEVSSGIYFARLQAGASTLMRKVVYLR